MKKFRKLAALALAATLAMTALTACGSKDASESADKNAETTEDATTVGFIYIGSKNDGGYTQAQNQGTEAVKEYFGDKVNILTAESVAEDKQTVKTNAENMIDNGASIIVGTSFGYMDAMEELSAEHPEVTFLHFSGNKMNDTNFANYFGAMEEPRYLSGIIAGMQTESNKIGYVAAYPYTEVLIGIDAFTLGVQSVNPDAEVKVVYINSWNDPANEKAAAESLLAQGCDVLAQHCDSTGPQVAAEAAGAYAIGYNLANPDAAPKAFLTAPIWHHDKFLVPTIESIINGEFKPVSYYGSMADGYVDLAPMSDLVKPEAKEKVEEIRKQMEAGEFNVFEGPIYDNQGNEVVKEGESLDRAGIWSIDYLVKGATGADN